MKKNILIAVLSVVMAMAFVVVASAASITFDVQDGNNGKNKIVGTIKDTEGDFRALKVTISFDTSVIVPVSKSNGNPANIAGGTVKTPVDYATGSYWSEDDEDYVNVTCSATPGFPKWKNVEGTKYTLEFEEYTSNFFDASNVAAFIMHFAFAEGKTADDITPEVFSVDYVSYGNGSNNIYDAADADKATIEVINSVVKEATEEVILPINESGVDLRVSGNEATSGIRFKADFQTAYRVDGNELGYIASVDKEKNYTDGALVLDFAAVEAGKAAKGIAYGDGKDIFWNVDGETTVITVALLGTPMTKEALQTGVAVRAYQIIDGTTYYANDAMRSTPYDTAKAIKTAGGEAYTKNQEYVDKIIDTVEGTADPTAIVLDISSLFE